MEVSGEITLEQILKIVESGYTPLVLYKDKTEGTPDHRLDLFIWMRLPDSPSPGIRSIFCSVYLPKGHYCYAALKISYRESDGFFAVYAKIPGKMQPRKLTTWEDVDKAICYWG